jgi:hypothetical protein
MPITVGHNLTATTPDDPLYEIRPSHWNDTHAATLNISATEISGLFSNANGISFGMSNNSITASHNALTTAALSNHSHGNPTLNLTNLSGTTASNSAGFTLSLSAAAPGAGGGIAAAAGTQTGTSGTINFANSNGITFGMSGSTQITASHNGLTTARASNDAIGLNTAQSNVTWTVNSAGLSLDARGYAGTGTSKTGNAALTLNSNGLAFDGSGLAGTGTSATNASITLNSNGLAISVAAPGGGGNFSAGVSNVGNTGGDTGITGTRLVLVGSNNITLSQATDANGGTISVFGGAGAAGNTGYISAGANTASLGTVVYSNSNGVSFGVNGQTVTASHNGITSQSSQSAIEGFGVSNTGNTAGNTGVSTGVDWVLAGSGSITLSQSTAAGINTVWIQHPAWLTTAMQSNAATISNIKVSAGAASANLSAITFADSNGVSFGFNASTITASHNGLTSQSNQAVSANNGSYAFQTLSFSNANGVSFGTSAGSAITASHNGLTTARASNDAVGLNTALTAGPLAWTVNSSGISLNASSAAGTTSGFTGANISGSMTHNTAGLALSLSVAAPGAAAENNWFALTGNTTGNTTASGSTIALSGGNNITLSGTNGSVIRIDAPASSSLVGTNGISVSTNGSTISVFHVAESIYRQMGQITAAATAQGNSLVSVQPIQLPYPVAFSNVLCPVSVNVGSAANNSSAFVDVSATMVLYTRNSTSLGSVASFNNTYTVTFSSNATGTVTGVWGLALTGAATTLSGGEYYGALHISTANTATGGAATTALANTVSAILSGSIGSAANLIKVPGSQTNASLGVYPGQGLISTGATLSTLALSSITHTGTRGFLAPFAFEMRNETVFGR